VKPSSQRGYGRRAASDELHELIRHIQELTQDLVRLRQAGGNRLHLEAKERELEQRRWRLAILARRIARDEGGVAA